MPPVCSPGSPFLGGVAAAAAGKLNPDNDAGGGVLMLFRAGFKLCSPAKLSLGALFTAGKLNPDIELGGGVLFRSPFPYCCTPEKLFFGV